MALFEIQGGRRLEGEISLQGAKNGALPIMAASLLPESGISVISNCPNLSDVHITCSMLDSLGCTCRYRDHVLTVDATSANRFVIDDQLMRRMRSSVLFLGALLSRFGQAEISAPGGCELGLRPIDLHLDAFRRMGAVINEEHGRIFCRAENGLHGCTMDLPIASVGATENIMIAASTAKGRTVLRNAAKEPEIVDLANYLRACGARIRGDGSTVMEMEGVPCLHGASHRVLPDRICAATYLSAVAVCGGCLRLQDAVPDDLVSVVPRFEEMGCRVSASGSRLDIQSDGILHAVRDVSTKEFPGFPTDAQPVLLASLTKSHGTTLFIENIFSNRYRYVEGLQKMGARVKVIDRVAVVEGVPSLYSADVEAPDLRGGAALIVAALAAEGISTVQGSRYIDRGYEQIETVLTKVGAQIVRREENGAEQTQNVEAKETTDQKG